MRILKALINIAYLLVSPFIGAIVAIYAAFACTYEELRLKNGRARSFVKGEYWFWEY